LGLGNDLSHALRRFGVVMLLALCGCAQAPIPSAPSWARFESPSPVTILGYDGQAMEPFLSRDGALLFFNNKNDPPDETDLHWAERIDDLTFRYRGRIEGANSASLDGVATTARDGRFCFISSRSYDETLATIYCGDWSEGRVIEPVLQTDATAHIRGQVVFDVELDADDGSLVYAEGDFSHGDRPRGADLHLARWIDGAFRLIPADDRLFAAINTEALEYAGALSADGRVLSFTRFEGLPPFGHFSIWIARREGPADPFDAPVRVEAIEGYAEAATFSPDGRALYFHRLRGSRFSIWRVAFSPAL
jgi:hypothetical protein